MTCARCDAEDEDTAEDAAPRILLESRWWCTRCEREYDAWSRRHASDIIWSTLSGTAVVLLVAIGVPLLGVPWIVATTGIFAAFGTLFGVHRWNARRRRRQFLRGATIPRAYLP